MALSLLALVLSLVQGAYSGVARSERTSRILTEQAHGGSFMAHRIADELAMAFVDPNRPDATGLVVETGTDGLASLAFTSRVPPRYGYSAGGAAEIGYLVESTEDGSLELTLREDTDLDGDLTAGGGAYVMLSGIGRFEIRCYDGEEWLEAWDSASPPGAEPLPDAVSITIGWSDGRENDDGEPVERLYRTTTPVYASQ